MEIKTNTIIVEVRFCAHHRLHDAESVNSRTESIHVEAGHRASVGNKQQATFFNRFEKK
jgi:hypothetical protein